MQPQPNIKKQLALVAVFLLSVSYSFAGLTARELQKDLHPWQQLAWQSWLGLVVAWALFRFVGIRRTEAPLSLGVILQLLGKGALGRVCGSIFFILACKNTSLATVTWITGLPTVVFWGWSLHGERVTVRQFFFLVLGLCGLALIIGPEAIVCGSFGAGEIFAILSTLCGGLGATIGRRLPHSHGIGMTVVGTLFVTASIASIGALVSDGSLGTLQSERYGLLALTCSMVAFNTFSSAVAFAHLSSVTATAIINLEAVWVIGVGVWFYGEEPAFMAVVGGGLISVSALFMDGNALRAVARMLKRYRLLSNGTEQRCAS